MKKALLTILIAAAAVLTAVTADGRAPRREFRGAWLHTVFQGQYKSQGTERNKAYLCNQLDSLKALGVNAVIFQVRPQADAFYRSELEPWSCYLTDGGKAPVPFWDPLEFMVEQTHARGMELHAWLNPYRVTSNKRQASSLPRGHIYHKHPERFVRYADGKLYFDPGLPENREFICKVVEDIVSRYDVDAIHFDDYFYPYPVAGKDFPDSGSYAKYGKGMKRDDWRRRNVDMLIEDVHTVIKSLKPWVRFGISPFGIYRNKKTDPRGSDTNGLQNYDALYADVLLWEREGWIDYLVPQLYWELEHKAASYLVLVDWWNRNAGVARHLYIGQDVARSMSKPDLAPSAERSQLRRKVELTRDAENIQGNCWWPGYDLTRNVGGVADSLVASVQATPALVPAYPWISSECPAPVTGIRPGAGNSFSWKRPEPKGATSDVVRYAVYRFESRGEIDLDAEGALVAVTPEPAFTADRPGVYVVTALDRVNNESEPSAPVYIR
ncbi:MAG: family 10 glycosylhydrolase [Muribaculaceae bacterium]|nr:family 10 glycosylhydrolase [Muribaculaceae bacterium]MDE6196384.1 family 10 glycosylhydrolase [Muribaculaceae bacterium]